MTYGRGVRGLRIDGGSWKCLLLIEDAQAFAVTGNISNGLSLTPTRVLWIKSNIFLSKRRLIDLVNRAVSRHILKTQEFLHENYYFLRYYRVVSVRSDVLDIGLNSILLLLFSSKLVWGVPSLH